jgi:anthranilate phosphoribosyltransferase
MSHAPASQVADTLAALAEGRSLDAAQARAAFDVVMRGEASHAEMRELLTGLRTKGETPAEVAGVTRALRDAMVRVEFDNRLHLVDTCGTGGGRVGTVNVSTGAAFVVAGAGVPVAKHGNRSFTSRSGSADVLEALGVTITTAPGRARAILDAAGFVFLFAPTYHPAMRHLAPVRRELQVATIMNLVGPLANPAGVERQVLGVADPARGPLLAAALAALGVQHALVVHADEGLDEVSPVGITRVWEVRGHDVTQWAIDPADHAVEPVALTELAGGEPADNARILTAALRDRARGAVREALALNAGAALHVAGRNWSLAESVERARASIDSGAAWEAVLKLRAATAE